MAKDAESFQWYAAKLGLVIIAVFVLQNVFPNIMDSFALVSSRVLVEPWTVVSYMFLHGSVSHIFSNLFSLVLFGLMLEKIVGSKNLLIIFFFAGIASGIASAFFYYSVIGASGAIFGILGVLAVLRPKMTVLAFGIPIPIIAAVVVWALLDFGGVFYPSSVASIGHLAGLAAGIAIGFWIRPKYKPPKEKKVNKVVLDEDYFRKWEEKHIIKKKK